MALRITPVIPAWRYITGREFNKTVKRVQYYKLTLSGEIHQGFAYREGLNIDSEEFVPLPDCPGLHFTEEQCVNLWVNFYRRLGTPLIYRRSVTVPDDAKVYTGISWVKADRLILGPREEI